MTETATGWAKVSRMLATIVQRRATGSLVLLRGTSRWRLVFLQGRLLWAIDHQCRVRRWQRALKQGAISFVPDQLPETAIPLWEVWWLAAGLGTGQLTPEQAKAVLQSVAQEVLFAAAIDASVTSQWDKYVPALPDMRMVAQQILGSETLLEVMQSSVKLLQRWEAVGLSPQYIDYAPKLEQLDWSLSPATQKDTSTFLTLAPLLNGQRSTWDMAVLMRQPMSIVVHILHHLCESSELKFLPLSDRSEQELLAPLVRANTAARPSTPAAPAATPQSSAVRPPIASSQPAAVGQFVPAPSQPFVPLSQTLAQGQPAAPTPPTPPEQAPLVMLIDDDPMVAKLLRPVIHRQGCRFVHVSEATRALAAAIEQRPDMILLDLVMPIVNGYELCTQLRRVSLLANIPIAIVTSNRGAIDRVRAKLAGASVFVPKPLRSDKIALLLRQYLPNLVQAPPAPSSATPTPASETACCNA
ncbi:MAG TPA: response regulator [Coleofasciculaceae cyanobacterium]